MSGSQGLSPNDVVNISLVISSAGVPVLNFGAAMAIGYSNVIDVNQRQRVYTSLSAIAADFGTTAPEYLAGALLFANNVNGTFYVGRWAKTATAGVQYGNTLSATAQAALLAMAATLTTAQMTVSVDGTSHALTALNFAAVTNMNGFATVIGTALVSATVTWNAVYGRLQIMSNTTGIASSVAVTPIMTTGFVDVGSLFDIGVAFGGAAPVAGIAAETPLAALSTLINYPAYMIGFALASAGDITDAQHEANAAFIEGLQDSIYGITTQDAGSISGSSTTDLAYVLSADSYTRSWTQYCSTNINAIFAWMGISSTVNFAEQNSTITLKFKTEIGVIGETLSETQYAALKAKHCNAQVLYENGATFLQEGWMCSGLYFDTRIGTDWQANDLQVALFNRLLSSPKIPQTDQGLQIFVSDAQASMQRGVNNGLCAPGVWNETITFGTLTQGTTLPKGFYVYMPPVALQAIADRDVRKAPPLQIAYKLAGAVHSASGTIYVNQ
jgi:hypothetical protein